MTKTTEADDARMSTIDEIVATLNEILKVDRGLATAVAKTRFSMTASAIAHPALSQRYTTPDGPVIAVLGLINGLIGGPATEWITAVWTPQGDLIRFDKAVA